MLLYLVAAIFATVILFASIPAAIHMANQVHIVNGREPKAGVSFAPDLIVMIGLWSLGTWLLDHFGGRSVAWIVMPSVSTLFLILTIRNFLRSSRTYQHFLRECGKLPKQ